jgi:hypothetical protein
LTIPQFISVFRSGAGVRSIVKIKVQSQNKPEINTMAQHKSENYGYDNGTSNPYNRQISF